MVRDGHVRVFCVDDNDSVADAIRLCLSAESDLEWAGRLDRADALLEEVDRTEPDVVLLDIDMPGKDPFEALEALTNAHPETRALMFTAMARDDLIGRAVRAGAWGYVLKSEGPRAMVQAIRRVAQGEFVLGRGTGT